MLNNKVVVFFHVWAGETVGQTNGLLTDLSKSFNWSLPMILPFSPPSLVGGLPRSSRGVGDTWRNCCSFDVTLLSPSHSIQHLALYNARFFSSAEEWSRISKSRYTEGLYIYIYICILRGDVVSHYRTQCFCIFLRLRFLRDWIMLSWGVVSEAEEPVDLRKPRFSVLPTVYTATSGFIHRRILLQE